MGGKFDIHGSVHRSCITVMTRMMMMMTIIIIIIIMIIKFSLSAP